MSNTLTVTIGRNLPKEDNRAMSRRDWARFQDEIERVVQVHTGRDGSNTVHYGTGIWDGVPEESAILTWFSIELDDLSHARIVSWLGQVARAFGQDSIAVMLAPVTFAA